MNAWHFLARRKALGEGAGGEDPRDLGLETVLLSMFINEPKKEMTNKLMEGA